MSYAVGQQVVCINDVFSSDRYWRSTVRTFPKLHGIYTVREIRHAEPLVGFCFYEFSNPVAPFARGSCEPAFNVKNFRPVKTTSIEVFRKLLAPTDDLVGVE